MVNKNKFMKPKAIVIRVGGTNCDLETVNALNLVGFDTDLVHINELIRGEKNLIDYNLLVIPGGFSFGDYISAGKIFAIELYYRLRQQIEQFVNKKNSYIIGICNGFQVLVKLGLLPSPNFLQKVTLTYNDSGKFECRWIYLKVNKNNPSPLKNLPEIIQLPVAHAEGKFFAEDKIVEELKNKNQILFQYCDNNGDTTVGYPLNPNGSVLNIAGITDETGHIVGLMPHPERFIIPHHFPLFFSDKVLPYGRLFFELIRSEISL